MTNSVLGNKHLNTAIYHMEEMAFPIEKLMGVLSFMIRANMEESLPDDDDLNNTFILLQDLAGEAYNHRKDFWIHYNQFRQEWGSTHPEP